MREEAEGHHVHIHTGVHGLFGHVLAVGAESVVDHLTHGIPVGNHQAVEAPFAAEDVLHHEGVTRGRHAVVVVEGGHQRHGAGLDGSLERRQIHIAQLALSEVGAVVVTAAFGSAVTHEMLYAGGHGGAVQAGTLVTAHHGFTHPGVQVSVLTAALGNAAPAGIAGNVQHGRERPANTLCRGFQGCHTGALFHQGGVKGGRQSQRNGIDGVETVNDVAAHQQRNVQAGFLYRQTLEFIQLHRVHLVQDGADLAFAQGVGIIGHLSPGGNLVHLADFLGQGHLRQQFLHAFFHLGGAAHGGALLSRAGEQKQHQGRQV